MSLPAKTAYTLTYKATNQAEIWQGAVLLFSARRLFYLNTIISIVFAFVVALGTPNPNAFFAVFLTALIVAAILAFIGCLGGAVLHATSVVLLSKLGVVCTTIIDEDGIRDKFGLIKFDYKWHQIWDVELKHGNVYLISLINGIQIPFSAFANLSEAEQVFAQIKQYKAEADRRKKQIAPATESYIPDPDFLIKSLQAEEEAKWREIEKKHEADKRQKNEEV